MKFLLSSLLSTCLIAAGAADLPITLVAAKPEARGGNTGNHLPTRRALLVGIGLYDSQESESRQGVIKKGIPQRRQVSAAGIGAGHRKLINLDGPKTDIAVMRDILSKKYSFTVISELRDQQATRDAILGAIQKRLIDDAAEGDICPFYYCGHGSQVKNTKGGEPDQMDESIVPFDWKLGARDIRDKELARLCLKALDKKIKLTVIMDCCHSGSSARGYPQEERLRAGDSDLTDVAEEPGFDRSPEEKGALCRLRQN